jgi:2,4-dienoyl-CoA reductase-like NADH-dependent reductase (Old Yellow Enzyme family)
MWRPKERIRHDARPGRWPSLETASQSLLFQPLRFGSLSLRHRTWVPAMVPWRASETGHVTQDVLDWYRRFAAGRPAALVVEATGIRDIPSGPLLRIGSDEFLSGLRELVQTVRSASEGQTRLFIQLIDFLSIRRRPERTKFLERFLAVTDLHRAHLGLPETAPESQVREQLVGLDDERLQAVLSARELQALQIGERERVTDTWQPHIRDLPLKLPGLFARAAVRAREAGFDGVELHYAHAYTMASFLSALNDRSDGYGGPRESRVRLPLEVYAAVRAAVGKDFVVGCRMLTQDCIDGGNTVPDAAWFARRLAAAGMEFISLSRGGKFEDAQQPKVGQAAYPYTGPSGYECMPSYYSDAAGPFGRNLAPAATVRTAIRASGLETPVIVAGGIHNFEQAEAVLRNEEADVVGLARAALADPDWFEKVRTGAGEQVRLCLYTNYCEALDQRHREVTCELWDRQDLDEPGVRRSADGKRRLVPPDWPVNLRPMRSRTV